MAIRTTETTARIRVGTLAELQRDRVKVVPTGDRSVAVFCDEGEVYAVDNRCPHMGFPLHRGTVRDGILTCHWHHAKFDLAGGCTFDPFADDVTSFHVEIRDGEVYLDPSPVEEDRKTHWLRKIDEGLEQNIRLVMAKSVIGLEGFDTATDVLEKAALFGVRHRAAGWSSGLSILTAMANVLPALDSSDRPKALFHALIHVAQSTANQPESFDLEPLGTSETRPERYIEWFRHFIEVRAADAAERTLRTAIRVGLPKPVVARMVFEACTDHLFLDEGHSLDFANKAFEILEHIGWRHAEEILPSLVPNLVSAQRMEETSSWRHPVPLHQLLRETNEELPDLIRSAPRREAPWSGHRELAEQILDGQAADTLRTMRDLVGKGVPIQELSASVAYAAAMRLVHFRVTNEFGDWDTVHHTFTYTNAVDQAVRRVDSPLVARGVFDGAMSVYLERFLNVPKQPIPSAAKGVWAPDAILHEFDMQGRVDETAQGVAAALDTSDRARVIRLLGHALLREDAGFHSFQVFEAGVRQAKHFEQRPEGDHIVLGVARFLTAHSPTVRAVGQTYEIADRLHRGESLADE